MLDIRQGGSPKYRAFGRAQLDNIPQLSSLSSDQKVALKAVSAVFPFKVNNYVVDQLIDWSDIPNDPIFQLTFPQRGMLSEDHYDRMAKLIASDAPRNAIKEEA